jgi:hypothetical protein
MPYLGDEVGRLVHGPPDGGHLQVQGFVDKAIHVQVELDQTDALHTAGDSDAGLASGNANYGGGRKARATVPTPGTASPKPAASAASRAML